MWFAYPQVIKNCHNLHCTAWHMPARTGFRKSSSTGNCPYTVRHSPDKHTYHTTVNLGKDKHGNVVREGVHAILAAARWGIPDAVFDVERSNRQTTQALHLPTCPGCAGGCLNPLHIHWGVAAVRRRGQEISRGKVNKGPRARSKKFHYTT